MWFVLSGNKVRWPSVLVWLVTLAPALVYLVDLPRFGHLQNNDYYGILASLADGDRLRRCKLINIATGSFIGEGG